MNTRGRFFDGVRAFGAGLRFVVLRTKSWPLAAVPALAALTLIGLTVSVGLYAASRVAPMLTRHEVGVLVLQIVLSVVAVLFAVVVGLTLAQPVSGPALDALSRAYESSLGGPPRPDGAFWSSVSRSLRVSLTALAVGAPIMGVLALIGLLVPTAVVVTVPLKAMVTALLIAWDMLDYPFSLRQMRVRERVTWIRMHIGAVLGFGLVAAASLLVPFLGLLMLPIGVTAATHLVMRHEPKP